MFKKVVRIIIPFHYRVKLYHIFHKVRWLFLFKGDNFYCICCDKYSNKFLRFGNLLRENAACPYCYSLERTRLLNYYLLNETDIFSRNKNILHFAPERMLAEKLKKTSKNYISADLIKGYADQIQDIQCLSYRDNTFDYIICSCVLGHIPNEKKAIDEIYRVLKLGGRAFIITVLNLGTYQTLEDDSIDSPEKKLKYYGEQDLLRYHGDDFEERLKRDIVVVKKLDYSKKFSKEDRIRFSLGNKERELIFVVEKC